MAPSGYYLASICHVKIDGVPPVAHLNKWVRSGLEWFGAVAESSSLPTNIRDYEARCGEHAVIGAQDCRW
jgi:hypothetical protein